MMAHQTGKTTEHRLVFSTAAHRKPAANIEPYEGGVRFWSLVMQKFSTH